MNQNNAPITEEKVARCFFCGKEIPDNHWFARLPQGGRTVTFCRPRCLEKFLEQTEAALPDWPLRAAWED